MEKHAQQQAHRAMDSLSSLGIKATLKYTQLGRDLSGLFDPGVRIRLIPNPTVPLPPGNQEEPVFVKSLFPRREGELSPLQV